MKKKYTYITLFIINILLFTSCTEQYKPSTNTFKEALVIESLLAKNQTSLARGNVFAEENPKQEIVIGFFDVSNVSEKRIYFNYENFNFQESKYPFECNTHIWDYNDYYTPNIDGDSNERRFLYNSFALLKPPYEVIGIQSINDEPLIFKVANPKCDKCPFSHLT